MNEADIAATVLAAVPVVLLTIFTVEIVAGLQPAVPVLADTAMPRTTVLIPAHDEAAGITSMIAALRAVTDPAIKLLVVADNCSDDTAVLARLAGARVVERHEPARRGKGYALAFGREALAANPPACIVVLDADCTIGGQGVVALARAAMSANAAMQACNLQRPDLEANPAAQISSFAFLIKNLVRQRGMVRLGGVAALTGTGMAIPWPLFEQAPLASADLAEDLALGVWLTRIGRAPCFMETVHIWSDAASGAALQTQRTRWERGFLATAKQQALPLLFTGLIHGSRSRLWLGLHLLVPPLALLFAVGTGLLAVTLLLTLLNASLMPAVLLALALLGAGLATLAGWFREGRDQITGRAILRIPHYIVAKLPLYSEILKDRGSVDWVRTRRRAENDFPMNKS